MQPTDSFQLSNRETSMQAHRIQRPTDLVTRLTRQIGDRGGASHTPRGSESGQTSEGQTLAMSQPPSFRRYNVMVVLEKLSFVGVPLILRHQFRGSLNKQSGKKRELASARPGCSLIRCRRRGGWLRMLAGNFPGVCVTDSIGLPTSW